MLLVAWSGQSGLRAQETPETEQESQGDQSAYQVKIEGLENNDSLKETIEKISRLIALQSTPTASQAGLLRRVEEDKKRFETALRSDGFYDYTIESEIDDQTAPPTIAIQIDSGLQYKLQDYDIQYDPPDPDLPGAPSALGLRIGMPARAAPITAAQNNLIKLLNDQGYPLATIANQEAVVDHADDSMSVTLTVDQGPKATFGPISFDGFSEVEEAYLHRIANWPVGETFDQRRIDELRQDLLETNLFDSVQIAPITEVDAEGQAAVMVTVVERKARSIGLGVSFSSDDEGFGGEASWEHRNFFGEQETLRFSLEANQIRQEANATFRKPNFIELDQALVLESGLIKQDTDAFEETSINTFAGLEREIDDIWTLGAGGSLEWSKIEDTTSRDTFLIGGVPLFAKLDQSNDLLNPTKGYRINFDTTPYLGRVPSESDTIAFLNNEAQVTGYYSPFNSELVTLAGRGKIGSIVGEATATLPANKRFYAGGGGSIRGYEFQSVGPLDENNDPIGGRSLLELSLELRFRVNETFGVVPFLDGGNVYDDELPDFSEDLQWAGGLGLRYFSAIGPIRFDIAFPINRRSGVDDAFQFYISIGQSF